MKLRRLTKVFSRAILSRHIHLQILAFGLVTLAVTAAILFSLNVSHAQYQGQLNHALRLVESSRSLHASLEEQRKVEDDFLETRSQRWLLLRERALRRIATSVEDLKHSLGVLEGQGATHLQDFEKLAKARNAVFGEIVAARRRLGFGLEDGLIAKFTKARADLRREADGSQDAEFSALAGDVLDSAISSISIYRWFDVHAYNTHVKKIEDLLASKIATSADHAVVKSKILAFVEVSKELMSTERTLVDQAKELRRLTERMRLKAEELDLAFGSVEREARSALEQSMNSASIWLWINILFAACVCATVPIWLKRTVSEPLQEMAVAMQRLSNGELDVTISRFQRRDELGKLSRAFFRFQRRMRELVEMSRDLEAKQRELIRRQCVLELILSSSPIGLAVFNQNDELVLSNERYSMVLFGGPMTIAPGTTVEELWGKLILLGRVDQMPFSPVERTAHIGMTICKFKDGRSCRILRQLAPDGSWVGMVEDITDRMRMDEHIAHMAMHDSLTDLPNRANFTYHLGHALEAENRSPITVLFFDLDRFKEVNDTFGHAEGDAVLMEVAERLRNELTDGEVVARLGGDEFALFAVGLESEEGAALLAQRVIDLIAKPYQVNGRTHNVGCSVGVALSPRDGSTASDLLVKADLALYRSKQQGRGIFHFFATDMVKLHETALLQERELRDALVDGQFELWYQPIYSVDTLRLAACEALIRWKHPTRGYVSPGEFIPFVERSGLISPIGGWVLKRACADAVRWPSDAKVCVNVSVVQLRSAHLISVIAKALQSSGLPPHRLEIEITESLTLTENEALIRRLEDIRALGVSLAMDDFGSGHSVLSTLGSFPFDKIKLDKTYVHGLNSGGKTGSAVMRAVAVMAQELNVESVGEGVETPEQLALIRSMGFTLAQGYLLARPMPLNELIARYEDFEVRSVAGLEVEAFDRALRTGAAA